MYFISSLFFCLDYNIQVIFLILFTLFYSCRIFDVLVFFFFFFRFFIFLMFFLLLKTVSLSIASAVNLCLTTKNVYAIFDLLMFLQKQKDFFPTVNGYWNKIIIRTFIYWLQSYNCFFISSRHHICQQNRLDRCALLES